MEHTQTFGEKAVGLSFNPSAKTDVNTAKQAVASAIDQMNDLRLNTPSNDVKRYASTAITQLEIAQMLMVKAITWVD